MSDIPFHREYPACPSCGRTLEEVTITPQFEIWQCRPESKVFRTPPVTFFNVIERNVIVQ